MLDTYLRLLHPFMPFVTETIWARLPHVPGDPELLIVADWPVVNQAQQNAPAEAEVASLIELVSAIRNARAEAKIEPAAWLPVSVYVPESLAATFEQLRPAIERLRAREAADREQTALRRCARGPRAVCRSSSGTSRPWSGRRRRTRLRASATVPAWSAS